MSEENKIVVPDTIPEKIKRIIEDNLDYYVTDDVPKEDDIVWFGRLMDLYVKAKGIFGEEVKEESAANQFDKDMEKVREIAEKMKQPQPYGIKPFINDNKSEPYTVTFGITTDEMLEVGKEISKLFKEEYNSEFY